jgi:phospholipid/cholesterol/gamma-HCH transport system substrate-binding protein
MRRDKKLTWKDLKVGMMLFAALIILAIIIIMLGKEVPLLSKKYRITTYLDNVSGLKEASLVMLAGVEVGYVEKVYFKEDMKKVAVVLRISKNYQDWIRSDSVAYVKTMGALGDKYIDVSIGSPQNDIIHDGGFIKGYGGPELDTLISQATEAITSINSVASSLNVITTDIKTGKGTVGQLISNDKIHSEIVELLEKLTSGEGSVAKIINDKKLYDDLKKSVSDISMVSQQLKDGNKGIGKIISGNEFSNNLVNSSNKIASLIDNVHQGKGTLGKLMQDETLYKNISELTEAFVPIAEDVSKGRGTLGKLAKDKSLYDNTNKLIQEARLLLIDIRENPKKYLHIKVSLF